ncbi:MAG TPA: cysteine-rich CWC family protein [Burkholderiaceae bacterium]|jgi:Cysteine-rich CWC|nr:cysteine-rich CWC family protein [Burkholderiaceae bacterium]
MQVALPVDPNLCPLCGQLNECAMEVERTTGVKQPPCWCSQAKFEATLLSRIPEHARGKACLCSACAQADAP